MKNRITTLNIQYVEQYTQLKIKNQYKYKYISVSVKAHIALFYLCVAKMYNKLLKN